MSIKLSTFRLISCYEDMVQDMSFPRFVEYVLEEATRENCFDSSLGCQINEHIRWKRWTWRKDLMSDSESNYSRIDLTMTSVTTATSSMMSSAVSRTSGMTPCTLPSSKTWQKCFPSWPWSIARPGGQGPLLTGLSFTCPSSTLSNGGSCMSYMS